MNIVPGSGSTTSPLLPRNTWTISCESPGRFPLARHISFPHEGLSARLEPITWHTDHSGRMDCLGRDSARRDSVAPTEGRGGLIRFDARMRGPAHRGFLARTIRGGLPQ